ncbi:hypothetical protein Q5P01_000565 [Channa striata]|uniref:Uncharacterized protein n=1 Tax=Channa striata TaxID=64152 RepID=A0AA88IXB0_CHASR|nr:hypothetical protein Q5P01_000565 [Channa striata]
MSEIAENTLGLVRFYAPPIPGFDYDREYKMLKPKVLFHTWVAIYGPYLRRTLATQDGRKLDYVSKIKSNARFLEKQRSRHDRRRYRWLSDRVLAKAKEHSAMFSSNSRKQDATVRVRAPGGSRHGQRAGA